MSDIYEEKSPGFRVRVSGGSADDLATAKPQEGEQPCALAIPEALAPALLCLLSLFFKEEIRRHHDAPFRLSRRESARSHLNGTSHKNTGCKYNEVCRHCNIQDLQLEEKTSIAPSQAATHAHTSPTYLPHAHTPLTYPPHAHPPIAYPPSAHTQSHSNLPQRLLHLRALEAKRHELLHRVRGPIGNDSPAILLDGRRLRGTERSRLLRQRPL